MTRICVPPPRRVKVYVQRPAAVHPAQRMQNAIPTISESTSAQRSIEELPEKIVENTREQLRRANILLRYENVYCSLRWGSPRLKVMNIAFFGRRV